MHYIVMDFEFNQDSSGTEEAASITKICPFEIIQIGAVKLDAQWNTVGIYDRLVKPTIYKEVSPFITELTGITTEQLQKESTFPEVYASFLDFVDVSDSVFCTWGKTDMTELFRNAEYFQLDRTRLPRLFINLQPYASEHLGQPRKKQLKLSYTAEALDIPLIHPFHDAFHDAYYTAEIFKKIMNPSITPTLYEPIYVKLNIRPRQLKRTIDFEALLKQFEKMYQRTMNEEEQEMIKLAYQMGKTGQFIKEAAYKDDLFIQK